MFRLMFPKHFRRHQPKQNRSAGAQIQRVAIYERISTDEQKHLRFLEVQRKLLENHAASQDGWVVTHCYADQKSGATTDRPELQRALGAAAAGEFDIFLVYGLDRLARRVSDAQQLVAQLQECGVETRSVTEPFDSSNPHPGWL